MPDEPRPAVDPGSPPSGVSRRSFLQSMGLSAAAGALADGAVAAPGADEAGEAVPIAGPGPAPLTLRINGREVKTRLEPATTLLEALRVDLGMTGSKEVCDRGACGCCSVLVDGRVVCSCMMLAIDAAGAEITTVEGLSSGDELDPVQEAFVKHDALQCGYCTPGLVIAARALLERNPSPSLEEIKHGLSGNICRCGTYSNVFNAVLEASGQTPVHDAGGVS